MCPHPLADLRFRRAQGMGGRKFGNSGVHRVAIWDAPVGLSTIAPGAKRPQPDTELCTGRREAEAMTGRRRQGADDRAPMTGRRRPWYRRPSVTGPVAPADARHEIIRLAVP